MQNQIDSRLSSENPYFQMESQHDSQDMQQQTKQTHQKNKKKKICGSRNPHYRKETTDKSEPDEKTFLLKNDPEQHNLTQSSYTIEQEQNNEIENSDDYDFEILTTVTHKIRRKHS